MRCDRVALIHGGKILEIDPPRSIGTRYPLPLIALRGGDRFALLHTLRAFPHAHAVYLFGDELHYTDARADAPAETVANELRTYLAANGHNAVEAHPIAAGIEDSFMELMGAAPAPTATAA
jgi:ABC-2 type transport system ATP-binding protein